MSSLKFTLSDAVSLLRDNQSGLKKKLYSGLFIELVLFVNRKQNTFWLCRERGRVEEKDIYPFIEAYPGLPQRSNMESFATIIKGHLVLLQSTLSSMFTGFWICLCFFAQLEKAPVIFSLSLTSSCHSLDFDLCLVLVCVIDRTQ